MTFIEVKGKDPWIYLFADRILKLEGGTDWCRIIYDDGRNYTIDYSPQKLLKDIGENQSEPWHFISVESLDGGIKVGASDEEEEE